MYKIAKNDGPRINEEITARTCRLIDADGSQLGLFGVSDAIKRAREHGFDLVEIAPNAEPPVCKILDYSKFKYEQARKAKAARKNQVKIEVKEMKFRPKIDVGDYETKKGHVLRFLKKGARVKITIMFRGREMAHPEQGRIVLDRLAEDLKPFATIEQKPLMEGRNMHMLVAPIKGAFDEKPEGTEESTTQKEK
ncbi:MAG: translation initiation factor IF-3 [Atopobiaceae bacterium]|nr:translation initiation factor IF-3 [Atopobiaceae bacterium]